MEFGHYTFLIRLEDDALLPPYKGSTFRGLLGHALKRVTCALKRQECRTCILRSNCTYAMVFETAHSVPLPPGARISAPPHPMVLEPPLTEQTEFSKGDTLECGLILFGKINRNLPYFIYAFDQMGKIGLGKKIRGRRSRFVLEAVTSGNSLIYSDTRDQINMPDTQTLQLGNQTSAAFSDGRLVVRMETPLRVLNSDCRKAELPFSVLMGSMVRRITSLFNCYGEGEPDIDYPWLIKHAESVSISDTTLAWFDWKRYSNRQEKKMFMGGLTGVVEYEGDFTPFSGFLEIAPKVHVGKNTAFGLGKIKL